MAGVWWVLWELWGPTLHGWVAGGLAGRKVALPAAVRCCAHRLAMHSLLCCASLQPPSLHPPALCLLQVGFNKWESIQVSRMARVAELAGKAPGDWYQVDLALPELLFKVDFVTVDASSGAVDNNGCVRVCGEGGWGGVGWDAGVGRSGLQRV